MTKKEEPLNLNHVGPSEVKSHENLKNQLLMDVQLIKRASIIPKKVNGIIKSNTSSLKSTCEYTHY